MNKQNQNEFGKTVREINGLESSSGTMKDLVFDPVSGDFVEIEKGANLNGGETIVTEMTNNGFAYGTR